VFDALDDRFAELLQRLHALRHGGLRLLSDFLRDAFDARDR
jgi:hypothetical protein